MENKCNNSENREQKKHARTNRHSADRVLHNTVIEPIGLRKFYLVHLPVHNGRVHSSHNTMTQTSALRKLTIS